MDNEEVFIGGWTRERLRQRSQNERYAVWKRARGLHSAEGNHLARAIELLGLPYAEPEPLADDDPVMVRLREVLALPEAKSAAVGATLDGQAALAGLDLLFVERLGDDYRRNEAAVVTAQVLAAELMAGLGYAAAGEKDLPARCIARRGVFWRRG